MQLEQAFFHHSGGMHGQLFLNLFINWVLFRHKGPIYEFNLSFQSDDFTNIDGWILRLSMSGIRELILDFEPVSEGSLTRLSTIYSCEKLTELRLRGCELDPPPLTFKGFLFLRCLSLDNVGLSADEIHNLVAVCPLLESFDLFEVDNIELKISAPNLKYMILEGSHEIIWVNAPLMIEISIHLTYYDMEVPYQLLRSSACDYIECFGGLTNLQKLVGSCYFTKYLSFGINLCHSLLVFHHIKFIQLDAVDFGDVKEVLVVAHLVIGAPNLHSLNIGAHHIRKDDESDLEAPDLSFKDLGCASNFKLERLRDVSLYRANGLTLEVELLKFLLESSPALETMSVTLIGSTEEEWNNLRAKLEGCNWASLIVNLCNEWRPPTSLMSFPLRDIGT